MPQNIADKTLINSLFPEDVITAEADPTSVREIFYPEEEAYIKNALPKRRLEFAAGRLCARKALTRLGVRNFPVLVGKNREPIWPPGIVGSISHTERYCGVVVASKKKLDSLGLDVELTGEIDEYYWKRICTRKELTWMNSLPSDRCKESVALIFSAKESLYKCQYAISKKWLNFHDVTITINPDIGEFDVIFEVNIDSSFKKGTRLKGKFLFYQGYVFTGVSIPKSKN